MADSAVAVIVPMYNEGAVIGDVVRGLREFFTHVICVDDGSSDDSVWEAREAGATVLRHRVNLGQGAALQTGFEHVLRNPAIEHVVTFDADGQHAVADAVAMVRSARRSSVDVVLGSRAAGAAIDQPTGRRILLKAGLRFSRWNSGLDLSDTHNGLRVLNRHAIRTIRITQHGMAHASEIEALIARHALTWVEHPVSIRYTAYSQSKGQGSLNAFNVVYDLLAARLDAPA
jgi:glycosyltransferase involved in cell wall biosynthesis